MKQEGKHIQAVQKFLGMLLVIHAKEKPDCTIHRSAHESKNIAKYRFEALCRPIYEELSVVQDLNFKELLDVCKAEKLSHIFLGNSSRYFITSSELVSNDTYKLRRDWPPIWKIADRLLSKSCGNSDQSQINGIQQMYKINASTLEFVYGSRRTGKMYCTTTGVEITDVAQMEKIAGRKFR